jgi:hypothetical protein
MPRLHFSNRRYADLPLHYGKVPEWLASRMSKLGGAIVEAIVLDYGRSEILSRLSDPMWFQSFGCVLGMDWHSSGITTSVMGALKRALNHRFNELGIYVCGGRGRYSRQTPSELIALADRTGLNGIELVRSSRLSAKVDNNAVQDGFQLYLHSFIVSKEGDWAVVQQGMNTHTKLARRYHWHSTTLRSFIEEPHTFIYGIPGEDILNLTDRNAGPGREGMLRLAETGPGLVLRECRDIVMPAHHDVREKDVDLKRLGSVLALAHERQIGDFESLLLLEGVGPRAIQSLALVSEIIHGTPVRFNDPARFSFAHGGKDAHPFPVPLKTYDTTIATLSSAIEKAKIGDQEKKDAIRNLSLAAQSLEATFVPNDRFSDWIDEERKNSWKYGGRSVSGVARKPKDTGQLSLF